MSYPYRDDERMRRRLARHEQRKSRRSTAAALKLRKSTDRNQKVAFYGMVLAVSILGQTIYDLILGH
jgi:hypothetical protein